MSDRPGRPAVFLDRDGTVIIDRNYLADADGVELAAGAGPSLRRLRHAGFLLVLVTNQSGVARGYFDASAVDAQHERLQELLAAFDLQLDGIYSCPHGPTDGCDCRKPKPGMFLRAIMELGINPALSWNVGDRPRDINAGKAAGVRGILLSRADTTLPDRVTIAPDLPGAVDYILAHAPLAPPAADA